MELAYKNTGLSWGGSVYPWKSAAVISAIVVGVVVIAIFVLWEIYGPNTQPLMPYVAPSSAPKANPNHPI
jgi:hypothetical protein